VYIDSPRGVEIAQINAIEQTPAVLLLNCADKLIDQEGVNTAEEEDTLVAND
jgi:hypothetical protein